MFTLYELKFSNGKVYIGQTSRALKVRISQHRQAMRAGSELPVHCAWRVLGEPAVRALSTHSAQDELHAAEIAAISAFSSVVPGGYNLSFGGETAPSKSPDVAAKIAGKAQGRLHTKEVKERLSAGLRERWEDPEYRAKVSIGLKAGWTPERRIEAGKRLSASLAGIERPRGKDSPLFGRPVSDVTRSRMSAAAKGKPKPARTAETRAKLSASAKAKLADKEHSAKRGAAISAALKANCKKVSQSAVDSWKDPDVRARRIEAIKAGQARKRERDKLKED